MWATLTLMTALTLTPAQAGSLQLTNERVTYGPLGPTRTDKKFLPGDVYFLNFDIEGLEGRDGMVRYGMKMELIDGKGKTKFASDTEERRVLNILGGNRMPGFAHAILGLDAEPGEYTLRLNVTDMTNKATKALVRKFEVAPRDFGIVKVNYTYDTRLPAPSTVFVGQPFVLMFGITGFDRAGAMKQPNVSLELRILDEQGKPTTAKPVTDTINSMIEEKVTILDGSFDLALTRPGKFTVELKATDNLSRKSSSVTLPLTVFEPQK